jgi:hypothetical protein
MAVSNEDVRIELENELELCPGAQELILRNEQCPFFGEFRPGGTEGGVLQLLRRKRRHGLASGKRSIYEIVAFEGVVDTQNMFAHVSALYAGTGFVHSTVVILRFGRSALSCPTLVQSCS